MPLYTISTRNSIAVATREKIANTIMNVHCGITGAPETFVNVLFTENVPLTEGVFFNILGSVRKGRTPEMNGILQQEMLTALSELLKLPELQMEISLFEVPAQWVMEGGEILPEPGEEAMCEWLQKGHG